MGKITKQELASAFVASDINAAPTNIAVSGMTDGQYLGITAIETMAASCSIYNLLYMSSSGYDKAIASADSTMPCVAMCLETGTGSKTVLKTGYIKNSAWSFTTGQMLYVSPSSAGLITSTKPVTTGQRMQIVGHAVSSTVIFFNPQYLFVEI